MIPIQLNLGGVVAASRQKIVPVMGEQSLRNLGPGLDEIGEAFWRTINTGENRLTGE